MSKFYIDIRSPDGGTRIAYLDGYGFSDLEYVINRNAPGAASLTVPARGLPVSAFRDDTRLCIYRRSDKATTATLEGETCFFVRRITRNRDTVTLHATSAMEVLARRIVKYTAGSTQARKNAPADQLLLAVLEENFGSLATGLGRAVDPYVFSIANASTGSTYPTIRKSFAWDNVLELCQDIAATCDELGSFLTFDVVQLQNQALGFRAWQGTRSGDRRARGPGAFVLSVDNGTLTDAEIDLDWTEAKNAVVVGGQGEGEDRAVVDVSDEARINASFMGRNEIFASTTQQEYTAAELTKEGQAKLSELRPRLKITGKIAETDSFGYGRDYNIDTLLTASVYGYTLDVRVSSVHVTVSGGQETIETAMSNESAI
jgi:hypothetical protein